MELGFEYVPAGHFIHEDEKLFGEYVPAGHSKHFDEFLNEYFPGLHILQKEEPSFEYDLWTWNT